MARNQLFTLTGVTMKVLLIILFTAAWLPDAFSSDEIFELAQALSQQSENFEKASTEYITTMGKGLDSLASAPAFDGKAEVLEGYQSALKLLELYREQMEIQSAALALAGEGLRQVQKFVPDDSASILKGQKVEPMDLANGKKTPVGTASEVTADAVVILHESGVTRVSFKNLTPEWRVKVGFDPVAAAKSEEHIRRQNAELQRLGALDAQKAAALKREELSGAQGMKDGINIVSFDAKMVKSTVGYTYVSWQVVLFNNSARTIEVDMAFSFRDSNDFELEKASEYGVSLAAGQKRTLTDTRIMNSDVWYKVEKYVVVTE